MHFSSAVELNPYNTVNNCKAVLNFRSRGVSSRKVLGVSPQRKQGSSKSGPTFA